MSENNEPTLKGGKICYIEIPSEDINASADFYRKVFGWQIRRRDDGAISFDDTVFEVSGRFVTGRKAIVEAGLVVYIMVKDAEFTLNAIVAEGGKIVQPIGMDLPEITARFTDPAGNLFAVYEEQSLK